ncbi:hypothetical protein SeMB42_g07426 [Synchytrium endobioticum]|uniref:Phosphodiesterase n=1 Tax=Synchytrium endobioticum TaxID=286115 RepID=A0A507C350_9FUNG|nr:hypothetical protein SeMB42_g07426 [Synchytrium endobioticum]TPX45597.1 hypothetical protein SeLEV6574_g03769 [Synchytrium endobioticum]
MASASIAHPVAHASLAPATSPHGDQPQLAAAAVGSPPSAPPASSSKRVGESGFLSYSSYFNEDGSDAIKGPIQSMMLIHYVWYGVILIVLNMSGWIVLFYWTLPLYFFSSYTMLQLNRLIVYWRAISVLPLMLSFIPYCVFQYLCGPAHRIFSILWFVSLMSVNLQIGTGILGSHVVLAVVAYAASYAGVYAIYGYFNNLHGALVFLPETASNAAINITYTASTATYPAPYPADPFYESSQAITFFVTIILLGIAFYSLQSFVRKYALSLLNSEHNALTLKRLNQDLQDQLLTTKPEAKLDLDSPLTKVINMIRAMQDTGILDLDTVESLDYVVGILSSGKLFMPNLNVQGSTMDSDVNKWINTLVQNDVPVPQRPADSAPLIGAMVPGSRPTTSKLASRLPPPTVWPTQMPPSPSVDARIRTALQGVDEWDYDIFGLADATDNQPLYYLGMALFEQYSFKETFHIDDATLSKFFKNIESRYHPLPYHNSTHAADVMQAIHCFLARYGLGKAVPLSYCFAGLLAGAIHDIEHPGRNNAFLINTASPLAIRYNDVGVLENFHCSRAFQIITAPDSDCNILARIPPDQFKEIRACTISMVLATDMARHFQYMDNIKNKIAACGPDIREASDRQLLMDIAIKCGDISNAAKPRALCLEWTSRIIHEFFVQGDEERQRGLTISMFMDRTNPNIPKSQLVFMGFFVEPLYQNWSLCLDECQPFPALAHLRRNREYWEAEKQRLEAQGQIKAEATQK